MVAHELNCILLLDYKIKLFNEYINNTNFAVLEACSRKVVTCFESFFSQLSTYNSDLRCGDHECDCQNLKSGLYTVCSL